MWTLVKYLLLHWETEKKTSAKTDSFQFIVLVLNQLHFFLTVNTSHKKDHNQQWIDLLTSIVCVLVFVWSEPDGSYSSIVCPKTVSHCDMFLHHHEHTLSLFWLSPTHPILQCQTWINSPRKIVPNKCPHFNCQYRDQLFYDIFECQSVDRRIHVLLIIVLLGLKLLVIFDKVFSGGLWNIDRVN